ncbi:hypothetical protein CHARACLAT_001997 [Characodon lateralis]|uniref:Uncharacterized protein n=1 Tax=Characodon lateralis TaxID=208331 RepID=A0ABU7EZT0_9TELE|nr:hypothetical protein [Characodon lateralis]
MVSFLALVSPLDFRELTTGSQWGMCPDHENVVIILVDKTTWHTASESSLLALHRTHGGSNLLFFRCSTQSQGGFIRERHFAPVFCGALFEFPSKSVPEVFLEVAILSKSLYHKEAGTHLLPI